ncbi:MAG TPA: hypothetical protein VMH35_14895 [Streptosporangiaceae bacterium]|nr:hypothetical protein [Streptosporangiaceae bacterium]
MRRVIRVVLVPVLFLILGGLVAGCGSAVKNVISSLAPSHSVSLPTSAPTSAAVTVTPSPVASPTTVQPTTPSPTTPAATTAPASTAAPTPSPTSTSSTSSTPGWLWLLLAAVVVAGIAFVWIARSASRRSSTSDRWRSAVIDVYARGSALHDAMASMEWSGGPAADQVRARWADIQSRADDLTQTLYRLRETAPDEDSRARVDDVLAALQGVRSAMDAERAPGAAPDQNEISRSRLYTFARSLRALHGDPPAGPGMA